MITIARITSCFAALALVACGNSVDGTGSSTAGNGGGSASTGTTVVSSSVGSTGVGGCDDCNPPPMNAIALPGPDALTIVLGNPNPTCAVPSPPLPCESLPPDTPSYFWTRYAVQIAIPTDLQKPGKIPLDTPGVVTTFTEVGYPQSPTPGDCPMSTGDFAQGTLEIATIDAAHVMFALTGTKPIDFGSTASASGVYDAIRCP